jgi:hypothetical protein
MVLHRQDLMYTLRMGKTAFLLPEDAIYFAEGCLPARLHSTEQGPSKSPDSPAEHRTKGTLFLSD